MWMRKLVNCPRKNSLPPKLRIMPSRRLRSVPTTYDPQSPGSPQIQSVNLNGLASELQELDGFLRSETERVQREIESVMAGIKVIIDAIAPWKRPATAPAGTARSAPIISARSHTPMGLGDARRGRWQ